jgi:hypothetical protein
MTEPRLLFVESVDANSVPGDTPLEHLRGSERIVRERGFAALSVVRSDAGHLITPLGFTDEAFDVHLPAGLAVAARTIESSMWGMPAGADYVAVHWIGAKLEDPHNFLRIEDFRWPMLYLAEPGDRWGAGARPRAVFGRVLDVRFSPDGRHLVWLESVRENHRETCLVWREEVGSGSRQLVTRIPSATAYFGDMAISLDGRWLLADSETRLVDLETGHNSGLGSGICAACWYPNAGPSTVLAAARSDFNEPARIFTLDLSTWRDETVGWSPRPIHGLQVAPDGAVAARMNHERDAIRGGWFDQLVVTTDLFQTTETVAAVDEASGWRRRATRPRWTSPWPDDRVRPVQLDGHFEEFLRSEAPIRGLPTSVADEALEAILPRIRHRLARLEEEPAQVVAIVNEIRALTEWSATADHDLALSISAQVMPTLARTLQMAAAATDSDAARQVAAIGALAAGEREPVPALSFG